MDRDNDGVPDSTEMQLARNNGDTDGDGIPDYLDLDSDNDGLFDAWENGIPDGNYDGIAGVDEEIDIYGVPATYATSEIIDTDLDGMGNYIDADSDNDTYTDTAECPTIRSCPDFDEDGIPDLLDSDCYSLSLPRLAIESEYTETAACESKKLQLKAINQNPSPFAAGYFWKGPKNLFIAETSSQSDSFELSLELRDKSNEGWYYFQMTSQQGVCPAVTDSVFIEVVTQEERLPQLKLTRDSICPGTPVRLEIQPGVDLPVEYIWYELKEDGRSLEIGRSENSILILKDSLLNRSGTYQAEALFSQCPPLLSNVVYLYVAE